jgi:dienelactone hydrolase
MCHPEIPTGQPVPDVKTTEVSIPLASSEPMPAVLAEPDGPAQAAVLVINDIFGRSPFYENLSRRLAVAGFAALAPEYFFREGPLESNSREAALARRGRLDHERAVDDLSQALDWLRQTARVEGRLGTVGFCMGGTFVLQLAARRDDLASVCFYGFPGSLEADERDRINGPLIGFWGDQDQGVGMDNVAGLERSLRARGVAYEQHIYPGLGHGFMKASGLEPDGDGYEQACEAWTRALGFLRQHAGAAAHSRT